MRTKTVVLRDLYSEQNRLTSLERTAHNTEKRSTAELSDKIIPSVKRKIAELEAELETAPEEPERTHWAGTSPPLFPACCCAFDRPAATPGTPEWGALEIPAALRRNPGGNDAAQ